MQVNDFQIGETYTILTKDWESPEGEVIKGDMLIKTIVESASKSNTLVDGETPSDLEIENLQEFLRVKNAESGNIHFLHPNTIKSAEILNTINR